MGIMSGSRNRLRRKGSTASSESGPPSWNSTMPTRGLPKSLLPGFLEPFDLRAQVLGPLGQGQLKAEEDGPAERIGPEHAVDILHAASSRISSTSPRIFSSAYRSATRKA